MFTYLWHEIENKNHVGRCSVVRFFILICILNVYLIRSLCKCFTSPWSLYYKHGKVFKTLGLTIYDF